MNTVIVGVDPSPTAHEVARRAANLAHSLNAPLHIVSAVRGRGVHLPSVSAGASSESAPSDEFAAAYQMLADLAWEFRELTTVTTELLTDDPAAALCSEATRLDASMIVVGNKRVQGASRILGSIAGAVIKQAPCDVLVAHTHG